MKRFIPISCPILFFLAFTTTAFSQVPGFLGKKFSIDFTISGFPALQGLTYKPDLATINNNQDLSTWHLSLNTRKIVDLDYVVSRSGSVGITLQYLRTGTTTNLNGTWINPYSGPVAMQFDNYINITSTAGGIYYKFFFFRGSGSIAPLGAYSQIAVMDFINSAQARVFNPDEPGVNNNVVNYGNVGSCIGITYSIGQQSIFFNRLIFNASIQFGIIPSYLPHIGSGFNDDDNTSSPLTGTNSSLIEDAISSRLAGMIFMNVNIGIGFIIF